MTVYAWPTLSREAPEELDWSMVANTQEFVSPLSGSVQTVEMPGIRWKVSFTMKDLDMLDSAKLRSFLAKLRGKSGRFTLHNMARPTPMGVATGTPVVSGAGQYGTSLVTSGWTASVTGILKEGDYFGVNGELKIMTADASSSAGGIATLTFEPPLRNSPANLAAITVQKPTTTFKLDEDVMRWVTSVPVLDSIPIAATETW